MEEKKVDKEIQAMAVCAYALDQLLADNSTQGIKAFERVFRYLGERYLADFENRKKENDEKLAGIREQGDILSQFTPADFEAFLAHHKIKVHSDAAEQATQEIAK